MLEWRNSEGHGPVNEGRATFNVELPIELIEEFLVNPHFEYRAGILESFKLGESTKNTRTVYKAVRLKWPFTNRDTLMTEHTGGTRTFRGGRIIASRSIQDEQLFGLKKSKQRGYVRAEIALKGYLLIPGEECEEGSDEELRK